MSDFLAMHCARCGEPIAHRLFVRPDGDDVAEHFDCHQRAHANSGRGSGGQPRRSRATLTAYAEEKTN